MDIPAVETEANVPALLAESLSTDQDNSNDTADASTARTSDTNNSSTTSPTAKTAFMKKSPLGLKAASPKRFKGPPAKKVMPAASGAPPVVPGKKMPMKVALGKGVKAKAAIFSKGIIGPEGTEFHSSGVVVPALPSFPPPKNTASNEMLTSDSTTHVDSMLSPAVSTPEDSLTARALTTPSSDVLPSERYLQETQRQTQQDNEVKSDDTVEKDTSVAALADEESSTNADNSSEVIITKESNKDISDNQVETTKASDKNTQDVSTEAVEVPHESADAAIPLVDAVKSSTTTDDLTIGEITDSSPPVELSSEVKSKENQTERADIIDDGETIEDDTNEVALKVNSSSSNGGPEVTMDSEIVVDQDSEIVGDQAVPIRIRVERPDSNDDEGSTLDRNVDALLASDVDETLLTGNEGDEAGSSTRLRAEDMSIMTSDDVGTSAFSVTSSEDDEEKPEKQLSSTENPEIEMSISGEAKTDSGRSFEQSEIVVLVGADGRDAAFDKSVLSDVDHHLELGNDLRGGPTIGATLSSEDDSCPQHSPKLRGQQILDAFDRGSFPASSPREIDSGSPHAEEEEGEDGEYRQVPRISSTEMSSLVAEDVEEFDANQHLMMDKIDEIEDGIRAGISPRPPAPPFGLSEQQSEAISAPMDDLASCSSSSLNEEEEVRKEVARIIAMNNNSNPDEQNVDEIPKRDDDEEDDLTPASTSDEDDDEDDDDEEDDKSNSSETGKKKSSVAIVVHLDQKGAAAASMVTSSNVLTDRKEDLETAVRDVVTSVDSRSSSISSVHQKKEEQHEQNQTVPLQVVEDNDEDNKSTDVYIITDATSSNRLIAHENIRMLSLQDIETYAQFSSAATAQAGYTDTTLYPVATEPILTASSSVQVDNNIQTFDNTSSGAPLQQMFSFSDTVPASKSNLSHPIQTVQSSIQPTSFQASIQPQSWYQQPHNTYIQQRIGQPQGVWQTESQTTTAAAYNNQSAVNVSTFVSDAIPSAQVEPIPKIEEFIPRSGYIPADMHQSIQSSQFTLNPAQWAVQQQNEPDTPKEEQVVSTAIEASSGAEYQINHSLVESGHWSDLHTPAIVGEATTADVINREVINNNHVTQTSSFISSPVKDLSATHYEQATMNVSRERMYGSLNRHELHTNIGFVQPTVLHRPVYDTTTHMVQYSMDTVHTDPWTLSKPGKILPTLRSIRGSPLRPTTYIELHRKLSLAGGLASTDYSMKKFSEEVKLIADGHQNGPAALSERSGEGVRNSRIVPTMSGTASTTISNQLKIQSPHRLRKTQSFTRGGRKTESSNCLCCQLAW